jgi:putative phosphoesterase
MGIAKKAVILSDTHLRLGCTLPGFVWNVLEDVDLILHAGDIVSPGLLEELNLVAPVAAVRGNCDGWIDLPEKRIVPFGPLKIGLTHGYAGYGKNTPERAYHAFAGEDIDLVVFGHSHVPYKEYHQGILLFNPGSPTEKRGQPFFSVGRLILKDHSFELEHLFF